MEQRLADIDQELSNAQRDFLVAILKRHLQRPDFHHGLLPFVQTIDALFYTELELCRANRPSKQTRFIRKLLSKLRWTSA